MLIKKDMDLQELADITEVYAGDTKVLKAIREELNRMWPGKDTSEVPERSFWHVVEVNTAD